MEKSTEPAGESTTSLCLMENGSQYYTAARFATHAGCMPVAGNLFHHAVEFLLKGGLARKRPLSELKQMGHNLDVLWRAFKTDFPDASLERHDQTISSVDRFEDTAIRTRSRCPQC
jgi:hypothetical protein